MQKTSTKLPGIDYNYCEKLGTSYDVTGFAIGSFLEHIVVKEQMMTSFRKTLKMLV